MPGKIRLEKAALCAFWVFFAQHFHQDFRFLSFLRLRESTKLLKRMDTRFRGYDEKDR